MTAAGSDAAGFSLLDSVKELLGTDRPSVQILASAPSAENYFKQVPGFLTNDLESFSSFVPSAAFATATVTTGSRSALRRTSATLNGTVTANGESTVVTFEYGLTTAYGNTVSATQSPIAPTGVNVAVSFPLTGVLAPGTTYHFRAVGSNGSGTTYGLDSSFTTPAAGSTTYYVDKTNGSCSDAGSGTFLVPFCTIVRALGTTTPYADAGDTVRVVNGTYAETVKWDNTNGGVGMPLILSAAPGVTVTGLAAGNGFQITSHSYVVVDGFTVTNTDGYGIYTIASNHLTISNNHVTSAGTPTSGNTRAGIYINNTNESLITGNTTDHNSSHGILLTTGASNNTVSNNTSFGNASEYQRDACGINLITNSSFNTIIHNTVYANEDTGLNFYSGSHDNVVVGNLTYGNGDHGIDNNAAPNNVFIGNTVQGNVTVGINLEGASAPASGGATVINNVMMDNGLLRQVGGGTTPTGSGGNLRVDALSSVGTTLDYNFYYLSPAEGGTKQIYWEAVTGSAYLSLVAFQAAVPGQETHGLQADPLLTSPAPIAQRPGAAPFNVAIPVPAGDYHLTAGSAAIDSANSDTPNEPTLDIEGNARVDDPLVTNTGAGTRAYDDRGAYEYQPPATYLLSVTKSGAGLGTVTSSPAGIDCGSGCSHNFSAASVVTLTAAVAPGSTFTGWSDSGCSGIATCVVTMDAAKNVTATFTQEVYVLTINTVGSGTVTPDIAPPYHLNDIVHLTAIPSTGRIFTGWSGDASGTTNPLAVTMSAAKTISASFAADDQIGAYMSQISSANLTSVASDLVTLYGPRHATFDRPYVDDICTLSTATPYPKSNIEMASDYAASKYQAMGYTVTTETIGLGGGTWTGHNVIATKTGTVYPNVFIEFGGHLDTQPTTPGAGDNASGSTAIIELARVLKDYPSRYSIRFINYVGHEHGGFNEGSMYHLSQVQARGEQIKAGLIMDGIGWSETDPVNMNVVWNNGGESLRIANLFDTVRAQYGIDIGWRTTISTYSDNQSYWNNGLTAVLSIGGTPYNAPGYHGTSADGGCHDTLDKLNFENIRKTAQQNLAVALKLDAETIPIPPTPGMPVVAAVASSANALLDTGGNYPMMAFDGNANTYWQIASDNYGYSEKWLQADLGSAKAIDQIVVDFGTYGTGNETIANDFAVWVGDDPTFAPGSYQVAANITNNADQVVTMDVSPEVNGRWVRYVVTRVTGPNSYDYCMAEMRIYGTTLASTDVKLSAAGLTASSEYSAGGRAVAAKGLDGRYDTFWHADSGTTVPQWLQADLGSPQTINRAVTFYYGGFAATEDGNKAVSYQILVGNDAAFTPGSYAVAASVTGNDSWIRQVAFAPVTGRYVRYVVTAVKGTNFWNAGLYELELWSSSQTAAPTILQQPIDQTANSGGTVTFNATASGNPAPTVQWQVSTDNGTTWNDISGATTTPLAFTAQLSDNGRRYRAVFTNSAGTATTNSALLTINSQIPVSGATASSSWGGTVNPGAAFDGNMTTFWHVAQGTSQSEPTLPSWLQADMGTPQTVGRVEVDYGPYPGNIATDFEFWVGNDPNFASGSYIVAAHVTGNSLAHVSVPFSAPPTGRYIRYVVNAVVTSGDGHGWWSACMYEMVIFQGVSATAPIVTQQPGDQSVIDGGSATFTAAASGSPAPTVQWQVSSDGGSTYSDIGGAVAPTLSFTVGSADNGHKYRAVFVNSAGSATSDPATLTVNFTITLNSTTNGTIVVTNSSNPANGDGSYLFGTVVTIAATPVAHYHLLSWTGDASGAVNPATVTMTANRVVGATFAIDTYTLTYTAGPGGTITGTESQTVNHGTSGTPVTAVPDTGYHFVSWSDGVLTAARTDLNVTTNISVAANFAINRYTITPSAGFGGSVSPSGPVLVDHGTDQTFTITPAANYHIVDVTVDGSSVGAVTSYIFTNVMTTHTIAATFAVDLRSISGTIRNLTNQPISGVNVSITPGSSTTTDGSGNFSFTDLPAVGNYTITPTKSGFVFDPISRSYSNLSGDITAADFVGYTGSTPRVIKAVSQNVAPFTNAVVPVTMVSLGNENTVAFTITYDQYVLSSPSVVAGVDCACTLTVVPGTGQLGITAVRTGNTVFAAGTVQVVRITFNTTATPPGYIGSALTFGDLPTTRSVANANADPLTATFTNGFVTFAIGNEAKLAPRYTHDHSGQPTVSDYIQAGRFAVGLDQLNPLYNEMQRADSAPRGTRGDGRLTAADYVQAGRYAAGLDPVQPAGGAAFASMFSSEEIVKEQDDRLASLLPRILRAADVSTSPGQQVTVSVEIDANGDENGFGFTISYDGTKLTNPFVTTGTDMPFSSPIANTLIPGRVGVITAWPTGNAIPAGTRQIVRIRFDVLPTAVAGTTPIIFSGVPPVVNMVSDVQAGSLPTTFTDGTVTILAPTAASASVGGIVLSAEGAAIRNARLTMTDRFGLSRTAISNSFGFFRFDDVAVGETYIISVRAKEYTFAPRVVNVTDEVTNLNVVAEP